MLLSDFVKHGLSRDPLRAGHISAAAMWTLEEDGDARLEAKLRADLHDLAALKNQLMDVVSDLDSPDDSGKPHVSKSTTKASRSKSKNRETQA